MPDQRQNIRESFLTAMFSLLGYVANCDGQINRHEIKRIKFYIKQMDLSELEQQKALYLLKSGTRPDFNVSEVLQTFRETTTPKLIQILLVYLITIAKADGYLVKKEMHAIQWIARKLGYRSVIFNHLLRIIYLQDQLALSRNPPKTEQERQQDTYEAPKKSQTKSSANGHDSHAYSAYQNQDLQKVYSILGVTSDMTDDEIRRAYQKLASQYHPDKLAGQGLPPEQINAGTERFKKIQTAYAFIKKYRSIYAAG